MLGEKRLSHSDLGDPELAPWLCHVALRGAVSSRDMEFQHGVANMGTRVCRTVKPAGGFRNGPE